MIENPLSILVGKAIGVIEEAIRSVIVKLVFWLLFPLGAVDEMDMIKLSHDSVGIDSFSFLGREHDKQSLLTLNRLRCRLFIYEEVHKLQKRASELPEALLKFNLD